MNAGWPRFLAWLLGLALWLAQAGAAAHGLQHLHDQDHGDPTPCELCLAYAGIGASVPSTPPDISLPGGHCRPPTEVSGSTPCLRAARARIRAPPATSHRTV